MKWVVLLLLLAQVGYGCFRSVPEDPPPPPVPLEEKAILADTSSASSESSVSIAGGLSSEPELDSWNVQGGTEMNLKDEVLRSVFNAFSEALTDTAKLLDDDLAMPESFKSRRRPKMMAPVCSVMGTDGSLVYNKSCPYDSMCWQHHPVTTANAEFRFCLPSIMALVNKEVGPKNTREKYPCVTPLGELPIPLPSNEIYTLLLCQDKLLDSLISQSCRMVNRTETIENRVCGFNESCTFNVNLPFGNIQLNLQLFFCANATGQPVFTPTQFAYPMPPMPRMPPRPPMPPRWPGRGLGRRRGGGRGRSSSSEESDGGFWSSSEEGWWQGPGNEDGDDRWPSTDSGEEEWWKGTDDGEEDGPYGGPAYPPAPPNGDGGIQPVFPLEPLQPDYGLPGEGQPSAWPQAGPIPPDPQAFNPLNSQGEFDRPLQPQPPRFPSMPAPQAPPQRWGNPPSFGPNNWPFQGRAQPAQNGGQGGLFVGIGGRSGSQTPTGFGQGYVYNGGGPGFPQTPPGGAGIGGFNPPTNGRRQPQGRRGLGMGRGRGQLSRPRWAGYTDGEGFDLGDLDDDGYDDGYDG